MFIISWLSWWYSVGWQRITREISARRREIWRSFGVPSLVTSLFHPWRHGIGSWTMQITGLMAALGLLILVVVIGTAELIMWPLIPIAGLVLIVWGFL